MPRFSPFRGVRYNAEGGFVDDVIAPPYDVISGDDRAALVARSEHNAVRLELPVNEGGVGRYEVAASLWQRWHDERVLVADDEPSFYAYRMGYHDEAGRPRQTTGILGALTLEAPGEGILPHEQTTSKDKADRFDLIRAVRANLSPIWTLSPTEGLSALAEADIDGPPDTRATDVDGVHHRLWRLTAPAVVESITEAVAANPVLVADGHHRYEIGLAYQAEVGSGVDGGGQDGILALVVELADEQLSVRAIHRVLTGLPEGFDLAGALEPFFEVFETGTIDETILRRMDDAGALALHTSQGTWLLRPRLATVQAALHDLDSSRLDVALASLPSHDVRFQHGWDRATAPVDAGDASAAVLLRPATVAQIAAISHGGVRMPPKTTFFYPKPATGLVFRDLDLADLNHWPRARALGNNFAMGWTERRADAEGRLRRICEELPEVHERPAGNGRSWLIRKNHFCQIHTVDDGDDQKGILIFRSVPPELDALVNTGHPFFKPGWGARVVGMIIDADVDWDEIAELVTESYCIQAPKKLAARVTF